MARIPEELIQTVVESNDIVDVITQYVPDLKRAGTSFKACCPFHMERTPSFNVTPSRQFYKCFGCGEAGNVLGFVMKIENLSFIDAVKKLAARANISIVEEAETAGQRKERNTKSRLIELQNALAEFMHELLRDDPAAEHAREYLRERQLQMETISSWSVGWHPATPEKLIEWAKARGYKARELVEAGLASVNETGRRGLYYRFRDRLMFPIRNEYGDVVGFSGRQLREDPRSGKYINSPETLVFKKSKICFGLDRARAQIPKLGYALLCEGQVDVIACHSQGFENAIATQGTACTTEHVKLLKRYAKTILLCYDSDAAGHKATRAAFIECAKVGLQVNVVSLPAGEDPDSLMKREGAKEFESFLKTARDFFDYKVRYEASQRDLNQPGVLAELAGEMSELLAHISDNFKLQAALSFLSTRLGMSESDLRSASRIHHKKEQRVMERQRRLQSHGEQVQEVTMNRDVSSLCHLHMNYEVVYEWLQEQIEAVLTVIQGVEGEEVLNVLLSSQPNPNAKVEFNVFMEQLPPPIQVALLPLLRHFNPTIQVAKVLNPLEEGQQLFRALSVAALKRQKLEKTIQLGRPGLSREAEILLQEEIQQIVAVLKQV